MAVSCEVKHISLSYDSAIPFLDTYIREMKKGTQKYLWGNLIYNNSKLETTQMSIINKMDKLWYTHTMEYYSAIKKNKFMSRTDKSI